MLFINVMSGYVFLFFVSLHMTKKFLFLFKMRGMIKFWIRKEGSKTVVGGGEVEKSF